MSEVACFWLPDLALIAACKIVPFPHYLSHFSLTVVDSDGASNSTTASLTVNKAVDYPPVANAGPNQVITLPQNSITLYGNQSTDDHGIVSYEWSLSPNSKVKVAEMQVRSPWLPFKWLRKHFLNRLYKVSLKKIALILVNVWQLGSNICLYNKWFYIIRK